MTAAAATARISRVFDRPTIFVGAGVLAAAVAVGAWIGTGVDWRIAYASAAIALLLAVGLVRPVAFLALLLVVRPLLDSTEAQKIHVGGAGSINVSGALALVAIAISGVALAAQGIRTRPAGITAVAAILLVSSVSAAIALHDLRADVGSQPIAELLRLVAIFAVYVLSANIVTTRLRLDGLFTIVGLSALAPALVGLYQLAHGLPVSEGLTISRIYGTFTGPNPYGAYLALGALILVAVPHGLLPLWMRAVCLVPVEFALIESFSREGWAMFAIGLALLVRQLDKRLVLLVIGVGLIALAAIPSVRNRILSHDVAPPPVAVGTTTTTTTTTATTAPTAPTAPTTIPRTTVPAVTTTTPPAPAATPGTSLPLPTSYRWRIDTWHYLLDKWKQRPLEGFGLRTTPYVNPRRGFDAHNTAVKLLVEGGIVLLAAWVALYWAVLRRLSRLARTKDAIRPYVRIACVMWILLIVVGLTTDDPLAATALMFAVVSITGAVQGIGALGRPRAPDDEHERREAKRWPLLERLDRVIAPAWERLAGARTVTRREGTTALVGSAALTIALFGRYIWQGGFNGDDWAWAAVFRHPFNATYLHWVHTFLRDRPGQGLYLAAFHTLFPGNAALQIAVALVIASATGGTTYLLLRTLGFMRTDAGAVGLLTLLFPFADSVLFWPTAATLSLAVVLFLAGLIVALRALESGRRRAAEAVVLLLWLASLLTYEVAAVLMLCAVLLYRTRVGWRSALRLAWPQVAVVVPVLLVVRHFKQASEVEHGGNIVVPLHEQLTHLKVLGTQSFSLLWPVVFPFGNNSTALQTANGQGILARSTGAYPLVAVGILVAGALVGRRARRRTDGEALRRWLFVAVAGGMWVALSYLTFVPSTLGYTPLHQGLGNRTNAIAAIGWVTLAYAVLNVAALLVVGRRGSTRLASAAALAAAAVVMGGYVARDMTDLTQWTRAYRAEQRVLAAVDATVAAPPRGSRIFVLEPEAETGPGITVFVGRADLGAALQRAYDDDSLSALPLVRGMAGTIVCDRRGMTFATVDLDSSLPRSPYGRTFAVETSPRRSWSINGPAACRSFRRAFTSSG